MFQAMSALKQTNLDKLKDMPLPLPTAQETRDPPNKLVHLVEVIDVCLCFYAGADQAAGDLHQSIGWHL